MWRQSLEIIKLNIRVLPQRLGSSLISVVGIACVVAVFVGLFSIGSSFQSILNSNADPDTLLILSEGASFEGGSSLDRDTVNTISNSAFLRRGGQGVLASMETTRPISVPRRDGGDMVNINARGVSAAAYLVRGGFSLVRGRLVQPGRFEVIVGQAANTQFAGLDLGDTVTLAETAWEVVGIFENDGGATESEVWTDILNLQSAYRMGNSVQSARVKLADPSQRDAFRAALEADPLVDVSIQSEAEFYEQSSQGFMGIVRLLSTPLVVAMALGAIFAALNTMYSSVSARTREIATLRAMGFNALPIAFSVLVEALLLALVGALLGVGVIYLGLNGHSTNTNFLSNTQYAFSFDVTPELMSQGIFWALAIGLLGGLFPAVRAARMPIVTALRAL